MKKHQFLASLEKELIKLKDCDEIVAYYEELINDALGNGEHEETFIKHLGTPSEIKYKLTRDDDFKDNIKSKKNFSASQTFSKLTQVLSSILHFVVAFFIIIFGLSLIGGGLFSVFTSSYHLLTSGLTTNAAFYHIFRIIFQITLIIFGIACFVYVFKYSKKHLEKLQLLIADKLQKGDQK